MLALGLQKTDQISLAMGRSNGGTCCLPEIFAWKKWVRSWTDFNTVGCPKKPGVWYADRCSRGRLFRRAVWSKIFTNIPLKDVCADVLHIINLLLITPFTYANVERMFSRMKRVTTNWRNKLRRDRLESLLQVSEEGVSIDDYHLDSAIEQWFQEKVRGISSAKSHCYPEKRTKFCGTAPGVINVAKHTLSDFEESKSYDSDEWHPII